MKRALVIGCRGNMGQRYQAILKYYNYPYVGIDIGERFEDVNLLDFGRIIIASPTYTHLGLIRKIKSSGIPILCEKPITKHIDLLENLVFDYGENDSPLQMVCQYDYLLEPHSEGPTHYDYFKHGSDGLGWDCIQIIGNAKSEPDIKESSPLWKCTINGQRLYISDMDEAYCKMLYDWLKKPASDLDRILQFHSKTLAWNLKNENPH